MKKRNDALKSPLNTGAIPTNCSNDRLNLLHLMQLQDSGFPIGTYTHSYGMETYVQEDHLKTAEDLYQYCYAFLMDNLLFSDLILMKEVYQLEDKQDLAALSELETTYHAMRLAYETRLASEQVGKQFLKTIGPLEAGDFVDKWQTGIQGKVLRGHFPIVYADYAAFRSFHLVDTLIYYCYATLNGLIINAVRAVPFGQNTGVQVLYRLLPAIVEASEQVADLSMADLNNNALGIELASMQHEYLFSRLFIS